MTAARARTGAEWRRASREELACDARTLARRLIGWRVVRVIDGARASGVIVETEAYVGVKDRASHARGGRRTPRNESMYARAGTAYVYFTYGMHWCFNVVCGRADEPVAVLVRALEPSEGIEGMRTRRGVGLDRALCSGPAKLTQALAIARAEDGVDLVESRELFLEAPVRPERRRIGRSPRVGVGSAGEWAHTPLRYYVEGNPCVSRGRHAGVVTRRRASGKVNARR